MVAVMSSINDSFLARLPESDKQAIIESQARNEAAASTSTSKPAAALQEINANPPPSPSAAARFGPEDQQIIYQNQLNTYHQQQAALAEEALNETQPNYDDFSALPPIVARAEYDTALAAFQSDPAVIELKEIESYQAPVVEEVAADPTDEPADLRSQAQQAVSDIHSMPLPDTSDIGGLPQSFFYSTVYPARVTEFNAQRAEAAQTALDELKPSAEQLQAMHPTQAEQALSDFYDDPYVQELERIVTEAEANPTTVPAYLQNNAAAVDPQISAPLTTTEVRQALSLLGIDVAENATPATLQAGREILDVLPDYVLGPLISPGTSVSFESPVAGLGIPGASPVGGSLQLTVQGEVELGDVQTGMNFEQTQQFEVTVTTQGEATLRLGSSRTTLQRLYGHLDKLSPQAQEMLGSSPLLDRVLRGRSSPVTGSYTTFNGAQLDYQAIVTPEQGAQLADGDMSGLPNPYDPLSMPQGTGVLIEGSTLEGSSFELTARIKGPLRAITNGTTTNLDGYGFSVTRLEGNVVEVQAGPLEAVEHDLFFGLGTTGINVGLGSNREYSTHDVQVARIDLSTEEGQQAYQAFISSGHVPDWNPPGVSSAGTTSIYSSESSAGFQANAGGASVNWEFGSHDFDVRMTEWQDGSNTINSQYVSNDTHTSIVSADLDAQGEPRNAEWTLVMADYNDVLSTYLSRAVNNNPNIEFEQDQNVQLSFSSEELMQLRSMAREQYDYNDHTRELLAAIDADPTVAWGVDQQLAVAETPEDVWRVISNPQNADDIAVRFLSMNLETGEAIPGTLRTQPAQ